MKSILLAFILLFLFSCKSDKKEIPPEFKDNNLQRIEFLDKKIYLPNDFKRTTLESFAELIKNSSDQSNFSEYEIQKLENYMKMEEDIEIFIKNENYKNNISFQKGKYINLTKEKAKVYLNLLENQLLNKSESFDGEKQRLESKYFNYGVSKVIKVKYLQIFGEKKTYSTQYLVTYKFKTFGIVVVSETDNDYQFILNNFAR